MFGWGSFDPVTAAERSTMAMGLMDPAMGSSIREVITSFGSAQPYKVNRLKFQLIYLAKFAYHAGKSA